MKPARGHVTPVFRNAALTALAASTATSSRYQTSDDDDYLTETPTEARGTDRGEQPRFSLQTAQSWPPPSLIKAGSQ